MLERPPSHAAHLHLAVHESRALRGLIKSRAGLVRGQGPARCGRQGRRRRRCLHPLRARLRPRTGEPRGLRQARRGCGRLRERWRRSRRTRLRHVHLLRFCRRRRTRQPRRLQPAWRRRSRVRMHPRSSRRARRRRSVRARRHRTRCARVRPGRRTGWQSDGQPCCRPGLRTRRRGRRRRVLVYEGDGRVGRHGRHAGHRARRAHAGQGGVGGGRGEPVQQRARGIRRWCGRPVRRPRARSLQTEDSAT